MAAPSNSGVLATEGSRMTVGYVDYLGDEPPPPPPEKKRKKLTKAEKLERKKQAEIEFRILEMTDNLRRELELSKKTAKKRRVQWLEMCKEIKLASMKQDLIDMEQKHNRILQQKDEKVQLILDDMAVTEEMHQRGLCMQLHSIDYLRDVFKAFQDHLKYHYDIQCKEILHDFFNKTCELSEIQETYETKFHTKLNNTNVSLQETLRNDFNSSMFKRNDLVNEEIIKRYNMRDHVAEKMNTLHHQLLEFLKALLSSSLDPLKYEKVNYLMQRQRNFVAESAKLNAAELSSAQVLIDLQKEIAQVAKEDWQKINDLKLEHAYFVNVHKKIEKRMKEDREQTHQKLKVLTTECYGICIALHKHRKYGELLLSLSATCRKLQTETEKVTLWGDFKEPLPDEPTDEPEEFKINILDLKAHTDLDEEELQAQMQLLKNFWRRQALAEAQTVLLEKKKKELLEENQFYIDKIRSLSTVDDRGADDLQQALKVDCLVEENTPYQGTSEECLW